MKTLKIFSLLAACSLAFACVQPVTPDPGTDPGTDPVEPVEPTAEVLVSAAEITTAQILLKTQGLVEYAYVITKDGELATEPLFIFKDGVCGALEDGETTISLKGLEGLSTYKMKFAFRKSADEFYETVLDLEFQTQDYVEAFTVISKSMDGFKFNFKMPQSVKDNGHVLRYNVGSLPMYLNSKLGWMAMLEPDMLLQNGAHHMMGDTTLVYDDSTILEKDANGDYKLDEWSGDTLMLHTPFSPGEPIVFAAGEFAWDDTDFTGWGSGWYSACYDYDAYYESQGGGGWGPWSADVEGELAEDAYWTGYFTRKYLVLEQPTALDCEVAVDFDVQAVTGKIRFTPDENVYRFCYLILPEMEYEAMLPYIDNNTDYLQWFVTSYAASVLWGASYSDGPLELVLQDMYYLQPESDYHLLITAMGDEKGTSQKFWHHTFTTTPKTLPAPEVVVTPIANPSGEDSPYEVWFNAKCTSKNAVSGKYAANYEREWAMSINGGATYNDIATWGNRLSDSDIAQLNSDEGMNFMFSSMPDSDTRLALVLYNVEETCNNLDEEPSGMAVGTTITEPAKPAVDSPLFKDLLGDWTMTAPVYKSEYSYETFDWVDYEGEKSVKVSISDGFTYPETLPESVYETYKNLVGKEKDEVDALYDEFKAEVDEFNAKLKSQNRLLCTGFGFEDVKNNLECLSPFDLFCSDSYNGYNNESMIWDCGPKWYIEVKEDCSAVGPVNESRFYPAKGVGYYTFYMVGANKDAGYCSVGVGGENAEFPLAIADDHSTFTIKPFVYDDVNFFLNCFYFSYGNGYYSEYLLTGESVLTKGWTEPADPEVSTAKTESKALKAVNKSRSNSNSNFSAKRKTSFKALPKYEKRNHKILSQEEINENLKAARER